MRSGRLHSAKFNTGSNPITIGCAGFVPFGMTAYDHAKYGDKMEIIFIKGRDITSPADIKVRTMAFKSPSFNSGLKSLPPF